MIAVTVILAVAAVGFGVSAWLRMPTVPLLVLGGIGLTFLSRLSGRDVVSQDMVNNLLMLGLTFLVFIAGMELNPRRAGRHLRTSLLIGLTQFVLLGLAGFLAVYLLGFGYVESTYMALAVSASSTIVVVRLLMSRRQFFEPFGRVVLGVLLLQDLLIIVALAVLSGISSGATVVTMHVLATAGMFALSMLSSRYVVPWLFIRLSLDQERMLLVALAVLFVFVGLSHLAGIPLVVGGFLAGISLSGFPVQGLLRGQMASVVNFFLAVFFVALGATLQLPSAREMLLVLALVAMVIVLTPLIVVLIAERAGLSSRAAIETGLLLAQCSEFSLIVALIGAERGHLDEGMVSVIALMTVVSMILTPFLATDRMTWRLMRLYPARELPRQTIEADHHILMLGCGANSRMLLDLLLLYGVPVIVMDEDPAVVDALRKRGIEAVRGNGADPEALKQVRAGEAAFIVSTMTRVQDNLRLLESVRGVEVLVRVADSAGAKRIRQAGGEAVVESEAAAEDFLHWFDKHAASLNVGNKTCEGEL